MKLRHFTNTGSKLLRFGIGDISDVVSELLIIFIAHRPFINQVFEWVAKF
ncbi:MAG: hypothetical protein QY308_05130 [Ignavibacteriaceae bacterium]|nr:MAG: hypothetical protein QY308_05130 [Ignavibacteriaceae bacterium]